METCVLIPPELSLVLAAVTDRRASRFYEMGVRVWSNQRIARGTRFRPFQGTIRLDKLEVYSCLDDNDIRHRFGCYDEIQLIDSQRVRHCNWIRFLRVSSTVTSEVNLIGTKVKGEPVFETTRSIAPNIELVAILQDDEHGQLYSAHHRFANFPFRKAMGLIIEESPLDLSMALLSTRILIAPADVDDDDQTVLPSTSPPRPIESSIVLGQPKSVRERTLLPCEVCGKAFDRPSLLKRHMRTHTGEKPHVCDVCGKGFSTSSSLNTHRRIHSGEKPHQCNVCGKRFTASSNLYYHRMTHNKEKPHKCTLCSKSFPTPGDLKSHMYVHNGSWPFKCHICNRGFSKQTNLKNHLFLHTGDKPHVCELCSKRFALACNLRAHLKTHEENNSDISQEECLGCHRSSSLFVNGFCVSCYPSNHPELTFTQTKSLSPSEDTLASTSGLETERETLTPSSSSSSSNMAIGYPEVETILTTSEISVTLSRGTT